ncbi:MAG TPA: archaemetzincin family Zn-dependent metalloprotease [Bryobacteraceae bacterium]|nr:archaemetzincin family Zn-dependent metalloprotease [Bryobacteraceae bacterium]
MKYLCVGTTPEADPEASAEVGRFLSAELDLPLRRMELPPVDFAFDSRRNQYGSIPVLEMASGLCPEDALKLIGLTERDLYIPVLTFVFGHAQLGGRVAVVSLARLRQGFYGLTADREIFLDRARKEALHETGHTFGLVHCVDRSCAMSLSTRVQHIDHKRAAYCPACLRRLSKGVIT